MTTTKAVLLSLTSAILAFNVGTHMETSKVAKYKLTHYKHCVGRIIKRREGKKDDKTMRFVVNVCGKHL